MVTLFHAPNSRSSSILWLLEEIGAPYTLKVVSIRRGDGTGAVDPENPHPYGKVPVITHNGRTIFETPAIALYLADLFPQAGLGPKPTEPERGAYLTWLFYYSGVIEPSLTAKFLNIRHMQGTFGWAPFDEVLAHLTSTLQTGHYLLGERFSIADILIGGTLPILIMRGIVPESDTFNDYIARIRERPAFGRARAKDSG